MMLRGWIVASALAALTHAQTLVRDIRPGFAADNQGCEPQSLVTVGGRVFFAASDGKVGSELWCTDGTPGGTRLVRDIRPGPGDSRPNYLAAWGNRLLFAADDGVHGPEPWISDGTTAGTMLVADLVPGTTGRTPVFVVAGPAIYIVTQSLEQNGTRIWKSDGTATGTTYVGAFPYSDATAPATAILAGKLVFLVANQLWITDGSGAGTLLLANLGGPFTTRNFLAVLGNQVFFECEDAAHGNELWSSDGTSSGTAFFADLTPGPGDTHFLNAVEAGARLIFGIDDYATTSALWTTDGTVPGTMALRTFQKSGIADAPYLLGMLGNQVVFRVNDGFWGSEPWISDGTPLGTKLLCDIATGPASSSLLAYFGETANGTVYFEADDKVHGYELWRTDGTKAGTRLVKDLEPGSAGSSALYGAALGNRLVFTPKTLALGSEPWITDGTASGTTLVLEIRPAAPAGADPFGFTELDGKQYFVADDGIHGREPWVTDGTPAGTRMVVDSIPGPSGPGLSTIHRLGDALLSFATLGTNHSLLVRWDGSSSNFQVLANPGQGAVVGVCTQTLLTPQALYFRYSTVLPQTGSLWRTNGTAAGTQLLWQGGGEFPLLSWVGKTLFFARTLTANSYELWAGDGTQSGSSRLATLAANASQAGPTDLIVHGGLLCFLATNSGRQDVWRSDGTPIGTYPITDARFGTLEPTGGPGRLAPRLESFAGSLWFFSQIAGSQARLWRSDGTITGGTAIMDFGTATNPMFTKLADRLLFAIDLPATGRELWTTDGSIAGTTALPELLPGPLGSLEFTETMTALGSGNVAVLAAQDGTRGVELWGTDGKSWIPCADLAPGAASSYPSNFVRLSDRVLMIADDGSSGRELFQIGMHELGAAFTATIGAGCPGSHDRIAHITALGVPKIANASFALQLRGGLPGAVQAWAISNQTTPIALYGGCTSWIGFPATVVTGMLDARGTATLALPIPPFHTLTGASLYAQCALADFRGAFGGYFSFSDALQVYLGR